MINDPNEPCLEYRIQSRAFKLRPHDPLTCPWCSESLPENSPEPEPFRPSPADIAWLNEGHPGDPTPEDWADYRAWCEEVDRQRGWDTPEYPGVISPDLAEFLSKGNVHE
jgi:hypothetical protein